MSTDDTTMDDGDEITTPVVISAGALEAITTAEVDVQIATARKYRRNPQQALNQAVRFATQDRDAAEATFYVLKRKDRRTGQVKVIEGPSIRLAEIMATAFGNLRWGARPVGDDGKVVTVQGFCHDLEANVFLAVEVQRRITDRNGRRYSDDMVAMTVNAACSIARRNALIGVIPRVYTDAVYRRAKSVAIGDAATLEQRRGELVAFFLAKLGVETPRVLAYLDRATVDDVTLADLEALQGLKTAIADGDTTVDEAFPPTKEEKKSANADLVEKVKGGKKAVAGSDGAATATGREPGSDDT